MNYQEQVSHYASVRARLMNPPPRVVPKPMPEPKEVIQRARDPHSAQMVTVEAHFAWEGGPLISIPKKPVWRIMLEEVAAKHRVHPADVLSHRRSRDVVLARHELFYRMREETNLSFPEIGKRLGGKDHTSVIHGWRMHKLRMEAAIVSPITNTHSPSQFDGSTKNLNLVPHEGSVCVVQF